MSCERRWTGIQALILASPRDLASIESRFCVGPVIARKI